MQFPDCHGRQRQRWRPYIGAFLVLAVSTVASAAPAAAFDEKLKAPMMRDAGELSAQAQSYAVAFRTIRNASLEQVIKDPAVSRERFNLTWQIQAAIDTRKPLDQLRSLGIVAQPDGSYLIDMGEHPEWNDLHQTIAGMLAAPNLDVMLPGLINRGFRPEDIIVLREYVAAHDPQAASAAATLPIALGFGRNVRKYDKIRRPIPDSMVHAFWYQRARAANESDRAWVAGLMRNLDAQRGRILLSNFLEMKSIAAWMPEDTSAGIAELLAEVRRPDFEARVIAEAKGVAP